MKSKNFEKARYAICWMRLAKYRARRWPGQHVHARRYGDNHLDSTLMRIVYRYRNHHSSRNNPGFHVPLSIGVLAASFTGSVLRGCKYRERTRLCAKNATLFLVLKLWIVSHKHLPSILYIIWINVSRAVLESYKILTEKMNQLNTISQGNYKMADTERHMPYPSALWVVGM